MFLGVICYVSGSSIPGTGNGLIYFPMDRAVLRCFGRDTPAGTLQRNVDIDNRYILSIPVP